MIERDCSEGAQVYLDEGNEEFQVTELPLRELNVRQYPIDSIKMIAQNLLSLSPAAVTESSPTSVCSYAMAEKDATYDDSEPGNVDFSYVNRDLGFGYVVDGSGHNNPQMQRVLEDILLRFNKKYEQEIARQKFNSPEEAQAFLLRTFNELGTTLVEDVRPVKGEETLANSSFQPAISFAQIVTVNKWFKKKQFLVSFELADGVLLIRKANGQFDESLVVAKENFGLGAVQVRAAPERILQAKVTPLEKGDTVIGFTDGIGEFLTLPECEAVIRQTPSSTGLLQAFKNKIIAKGKAFKSTGPHRDVKETSANCSKYTKYHSPDSPTYCDDMSLFVLKLS